MRAAKCRRLRESERRESGRAGGRERGGGGREGERETVQLEMH